MNIWQSIVYFSNLTFRTDVLWVVLPLAIATVVMLVYFERYKEERPGWNTHVANSLVLLFVSVILFKYLYMLDGGAVSFVNYEAKTIVSFLIFVLGILILLLNFEHYLPEKMARHVSSPLTMNLLAYIAVLYVYSSSGLKGWRVLVPLLIIFVGLIVLLNLIRYPIKGFFVFMNKAKEKERRSEILSDHRDIDKKKSDLRKEEKFVKEIKSKIKNDEVKLKREEIKKLDKEKKNAIKLKKLVRKK